MRKPRYEKKGDTLDRYREHLLTGKALLPKYQQYFEILEYTNGLLCGGYSTGDVAKILKNNNKYPHITQGYKVIRDTKEVFGDVKEASKKGERYILYESLMRIAKMCEKMGDLEGASKNYISAAKLLGLFKEDESSIDMNALTRPSVIVFSTDPALLIEQTEDIDYENVEEDPE